MCVEPNLPKLRAGQGFRVPACPARHASVRTVRCHSARPVRRPWPGRRPDRRVRAGCAPARAGRTVTGQRVELSGGCRFLPGDGIELTTVTGDYQRFALKIGDRGRWSRVARHHPYQVGQRRAHRDHRRVDRPYPQDRRAAMTEMPGKPDRSAYSVTVRGPAGPRST